MAVGATRCTNPVLPTEQTRPQMNAPKPDAAKPDAGLGAAIKTLTFAAQELSAARKSQAASCVLTTLHRLKSSALAPQPGEDGGWT
jgi:hypothetical protein